jgi:hypothetical protein
MKFAERLGTSVLRIAAKFGRNVSYRLSAISD